MWLRKDKVLVMNQLKTWTLNGKILSNAVLRSKRMKKIKRILAIVLLFCLCVMHAPGNLTAYAEDTQIKYAGETIAGDNIVVSKTIEKTDMENVFDITLKVDTKTEIHKYLEQPPMSVVIVLDISNTMFTNYVNGKSRFEQAMEATKQFITDYAASSKGAPVPRELAIVTFNTNAQVQQTLIDCAHTNVTANSICNSVETKINNLVGDLGEYNESNTRFTNIEAGLRLAQNILNQSSTENQYIILLTDGMPTTYSKKHNNTSTTKITGYDPVMETEAGTVGEDGVFYDTKTGYYCLSGVNYSDVAAKYAENRAKKIKDSGISIYSVGISIGAHKVSDFIRNNAYGIGSTVDYNSGKALVIESSDSNKYSNAYKNWLYNEIGSKYYADGNNTTAMTSAFDDILDVMHETSKEYVVEAWKTADPMNSSASTSKNVEFLSFFAKDGSFVTELNGSAGEGKENKASFDNGTDEISWILPESGYISSVNANETTYTYQLKYRIRLKNEAEDFVPNTPIETNGETTLSYMVNDNGKITVKTINYSIPTVEGYLGGFSFNKIDDSGRNISVEGAKFALKHSDTCTTCVKLDAFDDRVTIDTMTSTSDADGKVSFTNIPSGHEYVLSETNAPAGFKLSDKTYNVAVNHGKVTIDNAAASEFKYVINEKEKFELNYVIVSDDNPEEQLTDSTPSKVTDIPYNTNKVLAGKLTTTDTTGGAGGTTFGAWKFSGWYDNEACTGTPIDVKNIKQNETVYGRWDFIPDKFIVTYIVNPDPIYGIPGDTATPVDDTEYEASTLVDVADNLTTTWTTSEGTEMGTDAGVPGVWQFSGWDKTDFQIIDNTTITGSWTFIPTPETYTLEYVIVSTDNPDSNKTDVTPAKVEDILYNEDRVLAAPLTTRALMNSNGDYVEWKFSGWYDNEACTGTPISVINIKEDEIVYGKWTYTLRNHKVEYVVTGDSEYGIPGDTTIPVTKEYNYFDTVRVENNQHTSWTTSNGMADGIPGTWTFTAWDKGAGTDFTITTDTVIKGSWKFVPTTYSLGYVIVTSDNPNAALTTPTPSITVGIDYNTDIVLADRLTTTDTVNDLGSGDVQGTWRFSGWYEDVACTGNRIEVINIKTDEIVYGKWEFIEGKKYIVTYEVEPDPTYGKPGDTLTPEDMNEYQIGDPVDVADNLVTTWTTSDGTTDGYYGKWTFTPWDKEDGFEITGNTHIKGSWTFTPSSHTLEYVIVSDDNPAAADTDATPSKVTKIPFGADRKLALPLETLSNNNDGVPGEWIFYGWYDNEACGGEPIENVTNICEDKIVYGKWEFIPTTYKVKYEVIGDPVYGVPGDTNTPGSTSNHAYDEFIDVADNLITTWTTSDGTVDGMPGTWTFTPWDKEDFNIKADTVIRGEWTFEQTYFVLDYVIVTTDNPDADKTTATPVRVKDIPYNTDITLADRLTTTDIYNNYGSTDVEGAWRFYGWYDNGACTGDRIENINIKQNETVYGKWEFVMGKYIVDYVVTGDPTYGKPSDALTPEDLNNYDKGELVDVKELLSTSWTTSDGTEFGTPGKWEFVTWDKDDFNIEANTTIYGEWKFTPYTYKLEYVIVSTENPDTTLTDSTPSVITDIAYNTDITIADMLTTTADYKGEVPGTWEFVGWYDNAECEGTPLDIVNIKADQIVYGKWIFTSDNSVPAGSDTWKYVSVSLLTLTLFGAAYVLRRRKIVNE